MINVSADMKSLCDAIMASSENRRKELTRIREGTNSLREDARRSIASYKRLRKEMARDLKDKLAKEREDLAKGVNLLRRDFLKHQKEVRADLIKGSQIWNEMTKTLKVK